VVTQFRVYFCLPTWKSRVMSRIVCKLLWPCCRVFSWAWVAR